MKHIVLACALSATAISCGNVVLDGGAESDAGTVKPSPNCPQAGGSMVEIPDMQGGSYCIDQYEVTNDAYATWLDTTPSPDLLPAECQFTCLEDHSHCVDGAYVFSYARFWDASPAQPLAAVPPSERSYPVTFVSWCDAAVYCQDHGKRLCGKVGGGPLPAPPPITTLSDPYCADLDKAAKDPQISEYANAFTRGGTRALPYGDVYDATKCPGLRSQYFYGGVPGALHPVGSVDTCEGGYPGIFDLLGNAAEFINACNALTDTAPGGCIAMGSVSSIEPDDPSVWLTRENSDLAVGIRCCADTISH